MKQTDKFLIGIVVGVGILVIVAFVVVSLQPEPSYQPEDTAEGVAFNYLFALQQRDYERAYGYLSPGMPDYPTSADEFAQGIRETRWPFRDLTQGSVTLAVEASRVSSARTIVTVRETHFSGGGLFGGGQYSEVFEMELQQETGDWRIIGSDKYLDWRPVRPVDD